MKRNGAVPETDGMNSNGPVNRVRIDGFRAIINGPGIQVSGSFFFVYYFSLLILTEILIVLTNILLSVTPFMMAFSTITVFFLVRIWTCRDLIYTRRRESIKAIGPYRRLATGV